ncbi:MAG TPA: PASTA domain-containing protein [Terriglobia bacterium]|nr:PASTA domain-containing protein [Terriglobia bacterium]
MQEPRPQFDTIDYNPKPLSRFSRWSGIVLMVAILGVAGIVSALTAMRFAIRGREVEVPSLAGKTTDQAKEILSRNGLVLKVASSRFSSEVPEGQILLQVPPTGTRLKINRTVRVLVSLGERRFAVPNLVGTSLRAAQLTLAQRKLALGKTLYAHTSDGDSSTVVYQQPKPGTQEGSDPSVNILISLGPPAEYFIMPDLIGKSADLVASRARNEGFRLAKVNFRKYPGAEPGVVIQQKPQAGYRLTKSDVILLDVSQ